MQSAKLICLLTFIPFSSLAQKENVTDSVGFFVLHSGDTVIMYNYPWVKYEGADVEMSADAVRYYVKGKSQARGESQKKIRELRYGVRYFVNLPIASLGMQRLHEVILYNSRYMLTKYFGGTKMVVYVFDLKSMEAVVKKEEFGVKERKDEELIKMIAGYFPGCQDGLNRVSAGFDAYWKDKEKKMRDRQFVKPFDYITNYPCGG